MPGWQITLIAIGAALVAAAAAVIADRAWRHHNDAIPGQLSREPAQRAQARQPS